MLTRSCPDCGDDIRSSAKLCKCGWRESGKVIEFVPRREAKSDPLLLARSHSMYRGPSQAEITVAGEFPKPANGMGTWWARRIVRLAELGESPGYTSLRIAREALNGPAAA